MNEYETTTFTEDVMVSPHPARLSASSIVDPAQAEAPRLGGPGDPPPKARDFPSWHPSARVRELEAIALQPKVEVPKAEIQQQPVARPSLLELVHIEFVASSFESFRDVGRFQQALAGVPDVSGVHLRHLHGGTLRVRVQCKGTTQLLAALAKTYPRPFSVISHEPHRVEILLETAESRAEVG